MERFWTLRYLQQQDRSELVASVVKDNLVRAEDIPLVLPVVGAQGLPRNARVRVKLGAMDLITLDVQGTVVERLDSPMAVSPQGGDDFVAEGAGDDEDSDDAMAGPITIAVDLNDAPEAAGDDTPAKDGGAASAPTGNATSATAGSATSATAGSVAFAPGAGGTP
jgi:exoribonuclease-2